MSATASSASSRATERAASARRRSSSCSRGLVGHRQIGLRRDAAALERLDETREELAGARLDQWGGRLDVRCVDEGVGRGRPELRLGLLLDLLADALLEVRAQLGQRVELARRARELVVDRREDLLLHLLERDLDGALLAICEFEFDLLGLARRHPEDPLLDLLEHAAGADLHDVVTLRLAAGLDQVDDHGVRGLGRLVGGRQLGDCEAQRLDLLVDDLGRDVRARVGNLEPLPVGDLDRRLDVHGGREAEVLVRCVRQLVGRIPDGQRAESASRRARCDTSPRCGSRPPPSTAALCRCARAAPASAPSPCGSRGSSRTWRDRKPRARPRAARRGPGRRPSGGLCSRATPRRERTSGPS